MITHNKICDKYKLLDCFAFGVMEYDFMWITVRKATNIEEIVMKTLFKKAILVLSMFFMLWTNQILRAEVGQTETLLVTLEGRDVTADWSLQPTSQSYTLYYAYADNMGDIDIATLGAIEMGQATSIYVPNLPSGVIFYTAILAHHASQGDILSNIVKFMPFGGMLTYPGTGDVLIQINDPAGIGGISMIGTRNLGGTGDLISEIRGDNDAGAFVLYLTDNEPTSYEEEEFTINFIYQGEGSAFAEIVLKNSQLRKIKLEASNTEEIIDCSQYKNADEYLISVKKKIEITALTNFLYYQEPLKKLYKLLVLFNYVSVSSEYYQDNLQEYLDSQRLGATAEEFLMSDPKFKAYQTIKSAIDLIELTQTTIEQEEKNTRQVFYDNYNKQCNTAYNPVTDKTIANIYVDSNCPIPMGAKLIENESNFIRYQKVQYYELNGIEVGPRYTWFKNSSDNFQLVQTFCRNIDRLKHGWFIQYEDNGKIDYAINYNLGMNEHELGFNEGGWLEFETKRENGETVSSARYYQDGSLARYCDLSGCDNY